MMEDHFPFLIMTFYYINLLCYDTLQPINILVLLEVKGKMQVEEPKLVYVVVQYG